MPMFLQIIRCIDFEFFHLFILFPQSLGLPLFSEKKKSMQGLEYTNKTKEDMKRQWITIMALGIGIWGISGCTNHPSESETFAIVNVEEKEQVFDLQTLSPDAHTVVLETTDSSLVAFTNRIYADNDYYLIGSNQAIFFFDKKGRFHHAIQRRGEGPEEYLTIADFAVDKSNKQIWIWDMRKSRLTCYDYKGAFLREIKIGFWCTNLQWLDASHILLYSGNQITPEVNACKFSVVNLQTGEVERHFYPIAPNKAEFLHLMGGSHLSQTGGETFFAENFNDTIYRISATECVPAYYLDFGNAKIPVSLLAGRYKDIMDFHQKVTVGNYAFGISSLYALPDKILLAYLDHGMDKYLCLDRETKTSTPFSKLTDTSLFQEGAFDISEYEISFYADEGQLFMLASNALYLEHKDKLKDEALKKAVGSLQIDSNPVLRVYQGEKDEL